MNDQQALSPQVREVIDEMTTRRGYRDITALLDEWHEQSQGYLCVLQTPEGGPVYCRTVERLVAELTKARAANVVYECCPAPDPRSAMWMVVGNFEVEN